MKLTTQKIITLELIIRAINKKTETQREMQVKSVNRDLHLSPLCRTFLMEMLSFTKELVAPRFLRLSCTFQYLSHQFVTFERIRNLRTLIIDRPI